MIAQFNWFQLEAQESVPSLCKDSSVSSRFYVVDVFHVLKFGHSLMNLTTVHTWRRMTMTEHDFMTS